MKILGLQTGFNLRAGGARVDFEILGGLAREGHNVRLLMPAYNYGRVKTPPGISIIPVPARGLYFPQSLGLVYLPWIFREVRRFRPHLIRDHSPYTFGIASMITQQLYRTPVVGCYYHPETHASALWVDRYLLKHYVHIVTTSRYSAVTLAEYDPALAAKTTAVYCGVLPEFRPELFDHIAWKVSQGLPVDQPIFCTAGALIARKNQGFLIDLMAAWVSSGRSGVLVLVGNGEEAGALRKAIQKYGLEERVLLWGYTEQERYVRLLNVATAFLFPSLMEGFGIAAVEALACGTPALVSDRGSLPEVIGDKRSGFVLPLEQGVTPWLECLKRLCDEPELRRQMGREARDAAVIRFNWTHAARETAALYKRLSCQGHRMIVDKG